jgi:hypothetical protein
VRKTSAQKNIASNKQTSRRSSDRQGIRIAIKSIPFWTLVVIQFCMAVGWILADNIPRDIIAFAAFAWGVLIGILVEKGGLHPFNYGEKKQFKFIIISDECESCQPIQELKKAVNNLGREVTVVNTEVDKKSLR